VVEFLTYSRFYAAEQAWDLIAFLQKNHIDYTITQERDVLDKIYVGESLDPLISLKIKNADFEKVNELIIHDFPVDITQVNKDYYLFSFSDKELMDVLDPYNDWNYFDRALANRILQDRGGATDYISPVRPIMFEPARISTVVLVGEYLLTLALPYIGIIIGLATLAAFKTSGDGRKVKLYDNVTRNHAVVMLCLGIVRTVVYLRRWIFP